MPLRNYRGTKDGAGKIDSPAKQLATSVADQGMFIPDPDFYLSRTWDPVFSNNNQREGGWEGGGGEGELVFLLFCSHITKFISVPDP